MLCCRRWMTFFLLVVSPPFSILLQGVAANYDGDANKEKGDNGHKTSKSTSKDDKEEDEYIEPPSLRYDQFGKTADKESSFQESPPSCGDLYQLVPRTADGNNLSLEILRGKITLVVNIPSEYGLVDPNYHDFVRLQSTFGPTKLFNVIAFPCFEFSNSGRVAEATEIRSFLENAYGANFAIFDTVHCLGPTTSDLFRFLSYEARTKAPLWNFWKFLIGPDGHLITLMSSTQSAAGLHSRIKLAIDEILLTTKVEL